MSALYGVIGDPIAHSLSPVIHKGWLREHGIDAEYLAFHVPEGRLEEAFDTFARRSVRGLNVTLPHKAAVLALCDEVSPLADRLGAANTLTRRGDGGWAADNTDVAGFEIGFRRALEACGTSVLDGEVLVVGAGGAASAVACALARQGMAAVYANRSLDKAERLAELHTSIGGHARAIGLDGLAEAMERCAALVNATSLGHAGRSLDWQPGRGRLAYDLSYGQVAGVFLAPARTAGWCTEDGLVMLVGQAAESFERWFGVVPDLQTALARCRAALEMAS